MRHAVAVLAGRRTRRRWIHLVLGGAVSMPYVFVGSALAGPLLGEGVMFGSFASQLLSFAFGLPLAAVTALFPLTRPMSVAAVRALCDVPDAALADGPPRSRAARGRTMAWFTLHLGLGGIVSGMTLALVPFAAFLLALPVTVGLAGSWIGFPEGLLGPWTLLLAPVVGAVSLAVLAGCAAGAGGLLARWAPALLGPTTADRLAEAERRAADLAVRNRLARELHDSVGHALSAVTLQASAARRLLDRDPEFVREALAAIEDTTRRTVGELDAVLGVLREGGERGRDGHAAPAPTLDADLDGLLRRTRAGGLRVDATVDLGGPGDAAALPAMVSREGYRIVQEALSNVLKHAGPGSGATLHVRLDGSGLEIVAENPLPAGPRPSAVRTGGGHGLRGIADRARLLGGTAETGPAEASDVSGTGGTGGTGVWRLRVRLPLHGPPTTTPRTKERTP
ncbi:sensor histidine kinase [Streptomyces silvensis]|uniref:histidine kinase n=1 Tax=Streptomyces silvensis TaxID=1765722 RepID=A0A0W7WT82_9ACTN|nr:histidine kinase [Streptomyces silvensis]KUF13785.1 histidine kinase [Streptomyces silvensis]